MFSIYQGLTLFSKATDFPFNLTMAKERQIYRLMRCELERVTTGKLKRLGYICVPFNFMT